MSDTSLASDLRAVISALHKGLRRFSVNSYSMTEMETIGLLTREPALLPSQLAALTRVKTQTMSQILNKLEAQRVIKRTPSKEDKRSILISLTAPGRKMVQQMRYERDEWLRHAIDTALTEKEKDLLIKAVPLLNKLVDTQNK